MTKVLLVNHKEKSCGVYQFGRRVYNLASKSTRVSYTYLETNTRDEFINARDSLKPEFIIYNWYPCTMTWVSDPLINNYKDAKHYFIWHDGTVRQYYDGYLFFGQGEKDAHARRIYLEKAFVLPRPLLDYNNIYEKNEVLTIGSFGFGGWQKGFNDLTILVNKIFNEAILNIHMPFAFFGDEKGIETTKIANVCRELNINPGIELNITHDLLTESELLDFLARNDLNAFLYGAISEGLSSVIDYALSVQRPVAVTNTMMFRHLQPNDDILVEHNSLMEILNKGTKPLEKYYQEWSTDNFVKALDNLFLGG
ncbi:hypothetical protein LCGC14_0951230 [marine sediment metagenome]|uniref:Glycosyl transferase family 1 domain-containing protein n=1 Tax=marine sediment metagenome TaxID=412755 RepID=A0A0F9RNQ2_9ZZZZ